MSDIEVKRERDDDKVRDRVRRGDRQGRSNAANNNSGGGRERSRDRKPTAGDKRVYISNIAYEYSWQELKDLFRQEVGDVSFVKLFVDENDKPRGCGIVEFDTPELAKKAVQKLHRYTLKDRKLVVKEDSDVDRDKYGRIITGNRRQNEQRSESRSARNDDRVPWSSGIGSSLGGSLGGGGGGLGGALGGGNSIVTNNSSLGMGDKWGNMYGLSPQFLEYLCISGPLVCAVFVANLDFKVDQKKLKEVFKLAGRVERCELSVDKDGKSRGFGVVEYSHPVEAVQAISMLHNQQLFDRRITVRLDRADKDPVQRLPIGLKGLGMGLGSNGAPLKDVANNLPSLQMLSSNLNNVVQNIASAGVVPTPFAATGAALGPTAASLGVGNQITNALGLAANAGLNLSNSGVDRLMDTAGRNLRSHIGGGSSGIASLMGSAGGGNSDLGLGGGSAFGGGLGSSFGSSQLNSQNNFLSSSGMSRNFDGNNIGNRNDFDSMPLSSSMNNQGGGDFTRRSNLGSMSQSANNSNNSTQMTDAVIVRNLPTNVTWQQLKDKFSEVGNVTYAELRGKDTGLVQFSSQWEANRAINNFDRIRWDGRSLEVRFY